MIKLLLIVNIAIGFFINLDDIGSKVGKRAQNVTLDQRLPKSTNQKSPPKSTAAQQQAVQSIPPSTNNVVTRVPSANPNPLVPQPGQFCSKTFKRQGSVVQANGTQLKLGGISCSSNTLGILQQPSFQISSMIVNPPDSSTISLAQDLEIKANVFNLDGGFFSDPNAQYYLSPQTIENNKVQGHVHITVQLLIGNNVPDPQIFQFFKGVDQQSIDPNQREFVAVMPANTLKVQGTYRICSLGGSFTHQPIVSSVQRRGSPDDCIRVNVA